MRPNRAEPLVPLSLFRDRNYSLANVAISTISFTFTVLGFPLMLYAQLVLRYSPTESALLMVPMALLSIALAPYVGRLTDRVHPRYLTATGFTAVGASLVNRSVTSVGVGFSHSCAVQSASSGSAWCWGRNGRSRTHQQTFTIWPS